MFGDQFYLVALPWLVLQLTGSSLALGAILMLAAVPIAMHFGAAFPGPSDRRAGPDIPCARDYDLEQGGPRLSHRPARPDSKLGRVAGYG